jgi:hypothetical protein
MNYFEKKTTKEDWLEKNGFSADGITYLIGGDTFKIKEYLKENNAKFNRQLKWHSPAIIELSEEYPIKSFSFDELYVWNDELGKAIPTTDLDKKVYAFEAEIAGKSLSQFYGEVGERIRNMKAIYLSSASFNSDYGIKFAHRFKINENLFCWFTAKELDLEDNTPVILSGTVKSHEIYKFENITYLNRCIIKEA